MCKAKYPHFFQKGSRSMTIIFYKGLHSAKEQILPILTIWMRLGTLNPRKSSGYHNAFIFPNVRPNSKSTTLTHSTGKSLPPFLNCLLKIFFWMTLLILICQQKVDTFKSNLVSYSKVFTKTLLFCNYLKSKFPSFYNFFSKIPLSLSFILDKFQGVNTVFHFIKCWPYVLLLFIEKILEIKNR